MKMRKNKNSDENFTSLLSAIDRQAVAPDQEFLKQLRERSAREFAAGASDVSTNTPQSIHIAALRSIIMKSPITKLATAAIVAIACLIGLSLWRGTESGIALADVLAQIEKVKAFRCQWNDEMTGEDLDKKPYSSESRGTFLISQEYGWKVIYEEIDPNGAKSAYESYRLPDKKTMIHISHKQKRYAREEFDARWAQEWWRSENDPRTLTKEILECQHESLGRSTMDGIEVEGFHTTDPNWYGNSKNKVEVDVKMWVDVKTRLPVRYEFTTATYDQMGNKKEYEHYVQHDFQWDVPVDAAEFVPVIPEDYTGIVVKFPALITEETAIQGLKLCVELLGNYPDPDRFSNLSTVLQSALEKSETPAAVRLKEELKGLSEDDKAQRLSDATLPIRCLARFYTVLQWDKKDPAHYVKIVTPKDADKVLMRWKVSDNEYRVIFGDLHAETVTPEKLAELEAALPK
jgi:hypothetical protein